LRRTCLIFLALVFSFGLLAAPIPVDNFDTDQGPLDLTTGGSDEVLSGVSTGGNSIGGARILYLSTQGTIPTDNHTVSVNSGLLTFTSGLDDLPEVGITYDTNTDPLAPFGSLGGVNVLAGGQTTFRILARSNAIFNGRLVIYRDGSNFSWFDVSVSNTGLGGAFTAFDIDLQGVPSFTSGTGADLSAVDAIFLGLDATDAGGTLELESLEFAETAVPEPSTYLMMAAGLLLIGFRCKMRQ
jgi:hypothetical protein